MMKPDREGLLGAIREKGGPLSYSELSRLFDIDRLRRKGFSATLDRMVAAGDLVMLRDRRYAAPSAGALTGKLSMHRDGYGFVTPDGGGNDIFIPARGLRDNLHGDVVEVIVVGDSPGGKREGRVTRTVDRGQKKVVGRYEALRGAGRVKADDPRIAQEIVIPPKNAANAITGQVVVVELTSYPSDRKPALGRIVEVLGWPDDPDVEVITVIRKYELPDKFSSEAVEEARNAAAHEIGDTPREDLRGLTVVTIDGETARDFDDAVSVRSEAGGGVRLWVSIADVSHYVRPGSHLDSEAYLRGTSVYFPDRCLPMLPEILSNGICSLNPGEDRLTLTAEMLFDLNGNRIEQKFYPSVIKSSARLTYTQVAEVLEQGKPETLKELSAITADLRLMEQLARRLMTLRRNRGSLDFDLPEPEIVIDITTGTTVSIERSTRNIAHRLIEEFMLAANEAVAGHIEKSRTPSLYRIHEPPALEKILSFSDLAAGFGHHLATADGHITGNELQQLLDGAVGRPEELMLNRVLLRSMKQARYSAENFGHFGLAAVTYTHFTSPIRRYPDLVVHRILKRVISGKVPEAEVEQLLTTLPETAIHTSKRERVSMEAERELVELKRLQFMKQKVGDEFDGFIIGVTGNGFYAELNQYFVEGMVPVTSLKDDYYVHVEKQHALVGSNTRRMFRIGDKVRVLVASVSIEQRQIEFALLEHIPLQHTDAGWEIDLPRPRRVNGRRVESRGAKGRGKPVERKGSGKKSGKGKNGRKRR